MSLFDSLRDKAAELFSGATEQVGEVAGGLPGADAVGEQAAAATGAAEGYVADAQGMAETATGAAEGYVADAQGMAGTAEGYVADAQGMAGEAVAPYAEGVQGFSPETYRP